jgi:hypothetical protein
MDLPGHARFCARCGVRQPGARLAAPAAPRPGLWVLVLFWIGTAAVLGIALVYGVAAAFPDLAAQESGDASRVRVAATVVALCAGSLFLGQLLATIGLTAGWPWARPLATLVCVVWALTCVGLPVALLALNSIWKGRRRPAAPTAPNWR